MVLNILCRLPVKSLKRFQCASKSWHDLIHKPDFITQHLHVFNSSRKFDDQRLHSSCLLVNGVGTWWDRYRPTRFLHRVYVNLLDLDQTNGEVNSRHVLNLPLDYEDENPGVQILGPCNGIYCLHRTNEYHMVHVIAVDRECRIERSETGSRTKHPSSSGFPANEVRNPLRRIWFRS